MNICLNLLVIFLYVHFFSFSYIVLFMITAYLFNECNVYWIVYIKSFQMVSPYLYYQCHLPSIGQEPTGCWWHFLGWCVFKKILANN